MSIVSGAAVGPGTVEPEFDVVVIGAGVVGAAIARRLSHFDLRVVLVDSASDVGAATSKANTAILHTGFDATPGTIEARLVREGNDLLRAYCQRAGIAVERTGALLTAWTPEQLHALPGLQAKAENNGYLGCRPVGIGELRRLEPHLGPGALGALAVPDEAIVDPWSPPIAFATEAVRNGVVLRLSTRVSAIERPGGGWCLRTSPVASVIRARSVVNAAGLGSDVIDRLCRPDDALSGATRSGTPTHPRFTVTPRRGELIVFDKLARPLVHHILLPVPTTMGKGVLITPTVFGNVMLGPTAEDRLDRDDTSTSADGLAFLQATGRAVLPSLFDEEVTSTYSGLRAATEHADYQLFAEGTYVCVGGIRSTGLTASMAIAEHVVALLDAAGVAGPERSPDELVGPADLGCPQLGEMMTRPFADASRIASDRSYGEVVCHCERVTRGEIRDACASLIPATTLDGLRRRSRAMAGRCQGFHCLATLAEMLSRSNGTSVDVLLGTP